MQRLNHLFECCTVLCRMPFIVIEHIKFLPKSFECYVVMNYTHITLIGISDLCGYLIDLSQVTKVGVGLLSSLLDLSSSEHKHVCLTNLGFHGVDQPWHSHGILYFPRLNENRSLWSWYCSSQVPNFSMPMNEEFDKLRPLKIIFCVEFVRGNWLRRVTMTTNHEILMRGRFSFHLIEVVVTVRSTCHGCFDHYSRWSEVGFDAMKKLAG